MTGNTSNQNRVLVACGFRGSGKTTYVQNILKKQSNIFVYDPNEDEAYSWIPNTVHSLAELQEFIEWARGKPSFAARYVPGEDESGSLFDDANEFCRMVWEGQNLWVVFEEVHQIANTASPASMPPALRKIINRGRHRNISVMVTAIRVSEIPTPIRAGANTFVIFHTAEPIDVKELIKRIGSEATDEVMRLEQHQAVVFDVGTRSYFIADSYGETLSEVRGGFATCDPDESEETEPLKSENDNRITYFRKKA
jgi:hypothetical protein